jgi:hypothetical protein
VGVALVQTVVPELPLQPETYVEGDSRFAVVLFNSIFPHFSHQLGLTSPTLDTEGRKSKRDKRWSRASSSLFPLRLFAKSTGETETTLWAQPSSNFFSRARICKPLKKPKNRFQARQNRILCSLNVFNYGLSKYRQGACSWVEALKKVFTAISYKYSTRKS